MSVDIKRRYRGRESITRHWLINSMGIVTLILLAVEIVLIVIVRSYYYTSAKQYLTSKMNIITTSVMNSAGDTTNYNAEIRSIVESYEDKDRIELMAITADGDVDVTSSGFSLEGSDSMTDYAEAKASAAGTAAQIIKLPTGEKVVAVTSVISPKGCDYEALRMLSSMKNVDNQIVMIIAVISAIVLGIILLMFFTGMYFIRQIVIPIRGIADITHKYAKGDFSKRIEKKSEDELGQLCDSINNMAEELSNTEQMKNEFISSVSHELRTPLTAIKGWTETVATMYGDVETFKKGMRVINSETERLSQMVEELLDFSRIQDNRLMLQMDTIDILAELGETVLIYQERARALGITLNYFEPDMLPFVYGDKNRLRQVFINVVDNAIKYSDKGDTVSVEAYEEDGDICISVSDTGIGISKEDLPRIKQKFFKANHTRRGSGIGLAVADEIISRHGGVLTIDSEQGVGTTVMITLPCIEQEDKLEESDTVDVELISSDDKPEEAIERKETDEQ
ncbi:sensor histidine kinase [Ruminococcus albus]|uniref:histidine kinase n=1 Tax=Ruminococcus albus SY3 TaxID=1341156 RepID=A0A011UC01_RUMAL|nr:HAMP domain-containing sensor histidine kinase [Ruminococcus albus]EXM38134.1 histidine kinase [Ruminococcus albus SY3]MBE6869471.1 HAMP domain-containing histidine kinase [Ruminococcus albus]MBP5268366.1 HAMP domain-containing histidine kinase [Ruminococcus sp.]